MSWNRETARAYAELGARHHVAILRSVIPGLLGDLTERRVLDFGCGPVRLATFLAESGAARVPGAPRRAWLLSRCHLRRR
jgi:2-polyprenyl-3-methyl-5-hydroxy-6-metoxy-1,4-benzoquinol methylase